MNDAKLRYMAEAGAACHQCPVIEWYRIGCRGDLDDWEHIPVMYEFRGIIP